MAQYGNKMLATLDLGFLGVVCVHGRALVREGERENEIDLLGYHCPSSAVTKRINFSSPCRTRLVLSASSTLLSHVALSTSTAPCPFPDPRKLGTGSLHVLRMIRHSP